VFIRANMGCTSRIDNLQGKNEKIAPHFKHDITILSA
jgi:hypothetical protein